jgi:hypothetical protein
LTSAVTSRLLSRLIVVRSMASGHERFQRLNFVFEAKSAAEPPAASTAVKTDATSCPAASWTVGGVSRSSFQVTPWPPVAASMRRPVTMPVWLGSVTVISRSVRAFMVDAPAFMNL